MYITAAINKASFQNMRYFCQNTLFLQCLECTAILQNVSVMQTLFSCQWTEYAGHGKVSTVLPCLRDRHCKWNVWKFLAALYISNWIKCISKKFLQPAQMTCWSVKVEDWTRSGTELFHLPLNNLISLSVQTTLDYKVKAKRGIFRSISLTSPKIESVILRATNWIISYSNKVFAPNLAEEKKKNTGAHANSQKTIKSEYVLPL